MIVNISFENRDVLLQTLKDNNAYWEIREIALHYKLLHRIAAKYGVIYCHIGKDK